ARQADLVPIREPVALALGPAQARIEIFACAAIADGLKPTEMIDAAGLHLHLVLRFWKPWWVTGGYAQSVQQALSARSGGGLAAAWARGFQAGAARVAGCVFEGLRGCFLHSRKGRSGRTQRDRIAGWRHRNGRAAWRRGG